MKDILSIAPDHSSTLGRGGRRRQRWRGRSRTMALGALMVASVALAPTTTFAAPSPQSVAFSCVGFPETFNVPPGVTEITVNLAGAGGASGGGGGAGGTISGVLSVTPGHTLRITVGCQGGGSGGFGGDANGGNGSSSAA